MNAAAVAAEEQENWEAGGNALFHGSLGKDFLCSNNKRQNNKLRTQAFVCLLTYEEQVQSEMIAFDFAVFNNDCFVSRDKVEKKKKECPFAAKICINAITYNNSAT